MSYQKFIALGNVGQVNVRDVNGVKVASFSLAVSEKYTDKNGQAHENTEWFNVVCWRKTAELVEKFVQKGDRVFVDGKLKMRKYTDKDGNEKSVMDVQADSVQFLGKKESNNQTAGTEGAAFQELASGEEDCPF